MEKAYKNECYLALVAFGIVTLLTHIYPLYFLFPGLADFTIMGYPAHYFLTLVIGWVVLIPLYMVYISVSEKIDRDIAETSAQANEAEAVAAYAADRAASKGGAE